MHLTGFAPQVNACIVGQTGRRRQMTEDVDELVIGPLVTGDFESFVDCLNDHLAATS